MEAAIALMIAFIVILLIYVFGGVISAKAPKTGGKLEPYACGENFPPARSPVRLLLFNFAALFMIFDVIALFIAFTINVPAAYKPSVLTLIVIYGMVLGLSVRLLGRR